MNRRPHPFEVRAKGPIRVARRTPRKDVRNVAEDRYRGVSARPLPRPTKQYTTDRVCDQAGCETKLSRYNKWNYCWQHEPVHAYVPRGKRKSKKEAA
jgi:hypothetical protein